jgi:hypothetical protein
MSEQPIERRNLFPGTTLTGLAGALAKVQAELPKLERDRTVEVQQKSGGTYSYSYVTLANLSDHILPLLAKHGLSFVGMPGTGADGKMCLRYHLLHESGEALSGEFPISGEGGIQIIGGRITYARRYCLAAVVGVAADEDDEARLAEDGGPRTAQRARQPRAAAATTGRTAQRARADAGVSPPLPGEDATASKEQLGRLHGGFNKLGVDGREDRLRITAELIGRPVASSTELTTAEADLVVDRLVAAAKEPDPFAWLKQQATAAPAAGADQEGAAS